jgi:ABC-type Mn2+/Zn2+ transport system permease subunit
MQESGSFMKGFLKGFAGFFVISLLVAIILGWVQSESGYQPESLGGMLLAAVAFSAIGTLLLNVGLKAFVPESGPGFYFVI